MRDGLPLLLVFRAKTGCRQYPFDTVASFDDWTRRRPYRFERIRVMVIGPDHRTAADSGYIDARAALTFLRMCPDAAKAIDARLDAELRAVYQENRASDP